MTVITSLVSWLSNFHRMVRKREQSLDHYLFFVFTEETTSLTGDGATVISNCLVASWTSRSNSESESESEITIAAVMRSGARQQKEGRRSVRTAAWYLRIRV